MSVGLNAAWGGGAPRHRRLGLLDGDPAIDWSKMTRVASITERADQNAIVTVQGKRTAGNEPPRVLVRTVSESKTLPEKVFDALVDLKIATAQYAMHLSAEARQRLFSELDFVLEADAWDEGDPLPTVASYRRFLQWLVFTGDARWSSLGVDDHGNLLVAWVHAQDLLTANFGDKIRWTHRAFADGQFQDLAGVYSFEYFARKSKLILEEF